MCLDSICDSDRVEVCLALFLAIWDFRTCFQATTFDPVDHNFLEAISDFGLAHGPNLIRSCHREDTCDLLMRSPPRKEIA